MANIRLSRQQVEVIGRLATQLRVGGQAVMVAGAAQNGKLRVHGVTLEYMTQLVPEQAGNTIGPTETGIEQSVSIFIVRSLSAGNTIGIDDETPTLDGSVYNKSSESIIGPSANGIEQSVSLSVVRSLLTENTLVLSQDVFKQEPAGNTIGPSGNGIEQSVSVSVIRYPQVGNTLSLGQAMGTNQHIEEVDNTLSMSQDALATRIQFVDASSNLSLGQTVDETLVYFLTSTLSLGQSVTVIKAIARTASSNLDLDQVGWPPSHPFAASDIGIDQSVSVQKILNRSIGNALDLQITTTPGSYRVSVGNVLTGYEYISYDATAGYWNTVYQELTSTAEVIHIIGSRPIIETASNELNLEQSVSVSVVYNRTAENTINVKSTLGFIYIQDTTFCDYAPSVGTTTNPDAPTPPAVTPPTLTYTYNNIELSYPVTTPTEVLTLRGPELGNRDRLSPQRINRETRGGTLTMYADPIWPKVKQLEFQFIGLTENEGQELLDFIETSLGKEVKLRDWEGQEWLGVITSTEDPIVRNRDTCNLSASMSFELTSGD